MKTVRHANGSTTSRLGFGLSSLHHLRSGRERQSLLSAALDLGFAHFDAAPSYGDGLAERELGVFRKARGASFTLVSKFGILPDPCIDALPVAFAFPAATARALLRRAGWARQRRSPIGAALLRASVEASLRRLRSERIDLFLIHEPTIARLVDPDALAEELHTLRAAGKIGGWGLAGGWEAIVAVAARHPSLAPLLQTHENEWRENASRRPDIVYGAIAAGAQVFGQARVKSECAEARIANAIRRRPDGVVIVSTTRIANLRALAALEETL